MSKTFTGTGFPTARDRQYEELMGEFVDKVDGRIGELDERLQRELRGAAAEISRMHARLDDREATWRERFDSHVERAGKKGRYEGPFANREQARLFGLTVLAKTAPDADLRNQARAELERAGITGKSGAEGGFLTIEQFIPGLLANVDIYGTSERLFRVFPDVQGETVSRAKRGQGATIYFPDYGDKPTESELKPKRDRHELTRWSGFCCYDRWMARSQVAIALAEYIADELAFALALKQDTIAFVGDGTSTSARTLGVFKQPATGHLRVTADAADDTFQEIIDAANKYLAKALGKLPRWAHKAGPIWLMDHQIFFGFWGLQDANGKPLVQFLGGEGQVPFRLMGYPVEFTGVGPDLDDSAASTPVISVGAYGRGWEIYRHASGMELRESEHVYFLEGDVAVVLDTPQKIAEVDPNSYVNIVTGAGA